MQIGAIMQVYYIFRIAQKINFGYMFTQGPYLRVLSPRTTNGNNLLINERGMVEYKEDHLPYSAKRYIEQYNAKLPQHLRKKIEVVEGNTQQSNQVNEKELALQAEVERLRKQLAAQQQTPLINSNVGGTEKVQPKVKQ